ncbi:MAG: hypothetical protein KTR31_07030 [Myxococcales bacterium]|nr:hypothetical protein [Myxococcales bacterium]
MSGPRWARTLSDRFDPQQGCALTVARMWPPRLMVHEVQARTSDAARVSVSASVWITHRLDRALEVTLSAATAEPVDAEGKPVEGLTVGRATAVVEGAETSEPSGGRLSLPLSWTDVVAARLRAQPWVRAGVDVALFDGEIRRAYRTFLYLTAGPPAFPQRGVRRGEWSDTNQGWLFLPEGSEPACWLQPSAEARDLVLTVPTEPDDTSAVTLDGCMGSAGLPSARVVALTTEGEVAHWDASDGRRVTAPPDVEVERRTAPVLRLAEDVSVVLRPAAEGSQEAAPQWVDLPLRLEAAEESLWEGVALEVLHAELRGPESDVLGTFEGTSARVADSVVRLPLQMRSVADGQTRGSARLHVVARPVVWGAQLSSERSLEVSDEVSWTTGPLPPDDSALWLVIDVGGRFCRAAVAWHGEEGPHVEVVPLGVGGSMSAALRWSELSYASSDDDVEVERVLEGLRLGDGAHPECPGPVAATEVARELFKRVLLTVRERAAWLPLRRADLLITVPARLTTLPRCVRALSDLWDSVATEVLWGGAVRRVRFVQSGVANAVALLRQLDEASGPRELHLVHCGASSVDACRLWVPTGEASARPSAELRSLGRLAPHVSGADITDVVEHWLKEALPDHRAALLRSAARSIKEAASREPELCVGGAAPKVSLPDELARRTVQEALQLALSLEVPAPASTEEDQREDWERWMFPRPVSRRSVPAGGVAALLRRMGEELGAWLAGGDSAHERIVAFAGGARALPLVGDHLARCRPRGSQQVQLREPATATVRGAAWMALDVDEPGVLPARVPATAPQELDVRVATRGGSFSIATLLDGRPGASVPCDAVTEEPSWRGPVRLVVPGLSEDAAWEPWVVVAEERGGGRKPAKGARPTRLETQADAFLLHLDGGDEPIRFDRLLASLPWLGEER